jgi:hypothetical protein
MLAIEEFASAVKIMVKSLPTQKIDERIEGLYYFFKKELYETIRAASEQAAYEMERFPTPGQFAGYVKQRRPKKPGIDPTSCEFCKGYGMITAFKRSDQSAFTFRCHCTNAARFEKIPPWTSECRIDFELLNANTYQDLHDNPEIYARGIIAIEKS